MTATVIKNIILQLITVIVVGLLLLVFYVGLGAQLIPLVDSYQDEIEQQLSAELGMPVRLSELEGSWRRFNPRLRIGHLQIHTDAADDSGESGSSPVSAVPESRNTRSLDTISISNVDLELDVFSSFLERRWILGNVSINGLDVELVQAPGGSWDLGWGGGTPGESDPAAIFDLATRVASLDLENLRVTLRHLNGSTSRLERTAIRLRNRGQQHFLTVDSHWRGNAEPARLELELEGQRLDQLNGMGRLSLPDDDYTALFEGWKPGGWELSEVNGGGSYWAELDSGELQSIQGNLAFNTLRVRPKDGEEAVQLDLLSAELAARRRTEPGWEVWLQSLAFGHMDEVSTPADLYLDFRQGRDATLRADVLDLNVAASLLSRIRVLSDQQQELLAKLNPRGRLQQLELFYPLKQTMDGEMRFGANLDSVNINATGPVPGVWGMDGYLDLQYRAQTRLASGSLEVDSDELMLSLPRLFNETWHYDRINGRLRFELGLQDGIDLRMGSSVIVAESEAVTGRVKLFSEFNRTPDGESYSNLELMVGASQLDARQRTLYLPQAPGVNEPLRRITSWVDGAVLAGTSLNSGFVYRGPVLGGARPEQTALQAYFELEEGRLRFAQEWPVLENINASVLIDDDQVDIGLRGARTQGIQLSSASATVGTAPGSDDTWVAVNGQGRASVEDALDYLHQAPVLTELDEQFSAWQAEGEVDLELDLRIPLNNALSDLEVEVAAAVRDGALQLPRYDVTFSDIAGTLNYNRLEGLSSRNLRAGLFDNEVEIEVNSAEDENGRALTTVGVSGYAELETLKSWSGHPRLVMDILSRVSGEMDYQADVEFGQADSGGGTEATLRLESDLRGVELAYPAPLSKVPQVELPFVLSTTLTEAAEQQLSISFGEVVSVDLNLESAGPAAGAVPPWSAGGADPGLRLNSGLIYFGARNQGIPIRRFDSSAPGLEVLGEIGHFNFDSWRSIVSGFSLFENADPRSVRELVAAIDVTANRLTVFERDIQDVAVQLQKQPQHWELALRSEAVSGTLAVPFSAAEPMNVTLTHLRIPGTETGNSVDEVPSEEEEPVFELSNRPDPLASLDPREFPRLHVEVQELAIGADDYGSWEFDVEPAARGARFSNLRIQSRGLRIEPHEANDAVFHWIYLNGEHRSQLSAVVTADNMADVLQAFGYAQSLESSAAEFDASLGWQGSPAAFAATRLNGELDVRIEEGRFLQAGSSGALKLISIINFDAIVRRARFSDDLLRSGLAYEEITAGLRLEEGIVTIEDRLQIIGPSSLFQITGQVDLAAETIDGHMYVTLPLSDNIPWLGGIAALNNLINWQVAVGVYIFDRVFGDQVDSLTSARYRLRGTWQDLRPTLDQVFESAPAQIELEEAAAAESAPEQASPPGLTEGNLNAADTGDTP